MSDLSFIELTLDPLKTEIEKALYPYKVLVYADLNVSLIDLLEGEILDSSNRMVVIKGSREEGGLKKSYSDN